MTCDFYRNRMADHVTGRLTGEETAQIEEHLDGCANCRAFQQELTQFYELDLFPEIPPLPLQKTKFRALLNRRRRRRTISLALAGLTAAVVIAGLLFNNAFNSDSVDQPLLVKLEPVSLEMPEYPRSYPLSETMADKEQAALLSGYSGRAVLTSYIFPPCPNCKRMKKAFSSAAGKKIFNSFIAVERKCGMKRPVSGLENYKTKYRKIYMMPAVTLTRGNKTSDPLFAIRKLEDLTAFIDKWNTRWADSLKPLPSEIYQNCVELFNLLPMQLKNAEFGPVLHRLNEVIAMEGTFRTRFITEAKQLHAALTDKLRHRMQKLTDPANKENQAERQAKAKLLVKNLGNTSLGQELAKQLRAR